MRKTTLNKFYQLFTAFVLFACFNAQAQYVKIYGKVINDTDHTTMPGVAVELYTMDSLKQYVVATDNSGGFVFSNVPAVKYKFRASFIGYANIDRVIPYSATDVNLGSIRMKWNATNMKTAVIQGKIVPVQQKEDTTEFNADAFKTHPDASAEDLVNKMPGVNSQNGSVTVNGENVTQVLVDGEPFFGNDPAIALKNLPAEVVDKIQVFDKLSDQAQFTGFDDGNTQKTINIVTRRNRRNGTFGKAYAGYGTDDRYLAGGNLNLFNGTSRFSILGLANNVNQQNFATEDILGALSGGGGGRGGRGGGGSFGGGSGSAGMGSGGGYSQGANNFLIGSQNGITTTNSVGTNYTNAWNKNKIKLTASYFFNNSSNDNTTNSTTNYTSGEQASNVLNENSTSANRNFNNRLNSRFQWSVDSINSLIATVNGSTQQTKATSSFYENDILGDLLQSFSQTNNGSSNLGYDFSSNLLYMHKFKKKGRTVSFNVSSDFNNKNTPGNLYALNGYINDTTLLNQQFTQYTNGYTISPTLSYTEPLDSNSILQFNYSPSININNTNKQTLNYDSVTGEFIKVDSNLSNEYRSQYITQSAGLSYRLNVKKKFFVMLSGNVQYATLSSIEELPESGTISKSFLNVLPRMVLNWRFSQSKNLRVMYRSNVAAPSVSQLQDVVNNSNPLLLSTGNPALKQDFTQSLIARYGATNSAKRTTFLVYMYAAYTQNYIGNSTYLPLKDSTFGNGVVLQKGSQLSIPQNFQGYWNTKSFITYGCLINPIKCNLNFNGGLVYTRTPSLINNDENFASNYTLSGGVTISSDISENVDFTLGYTDNYSTASNTLQNSADDHYLSQVASGKINLIFFKGLVLNSIVTYTMYTGLTDIYNQNICLWNASIGYKFLKQRALYVFVSVSDILNQNTSITRTVTDTYIQDSQTQVLQRYYMVNVQYTIKKFKHAAPPTS